MTCYDSSFLIDYLDGDEAALEYAEEHADETATAPHLVLYEVYLGELYTHGDPDFDRVSDALTWITPIREHGPAFGRHAAALMDRFMDNGSPLGVRDGYVAAVAWSRDERLVTRDGDFDVPAVQDAIDVDVV